MIGSLQKNKINKLLGKIKLIHSLDSLSLIEALDKRLASNNMELDGLLQVNISKEESKSGFYKDCLLYTSDAADEQPTYTWLYDYGSIYRG